MSNGDLWPELPPKPKEPVGEYVWLDEQLERLQNAALLVGYKNTGHRAHVENRNTVKAAIIKRLSRHTG